MVETHQATGVGTVMENQRILELPLNGRVATDLIQYTGGVIPQGVAGNTGYPGLLQQFVINGGQALRRRVLAGWLGIQQPVGLGEPALSLSGRAAGI